MVENDNQVIIVDVDWVEMLLSHPPGADSEAHMVCQICGWHESFDEKIMDQEGKPIKEAVINLEKQGNKWWIEYLQHIGEQVRIKRNIKQKGKVLH